MLPFICLCHMMAGQPHFVCQFFIFLGLSIRLYPMSSLLYPLVLYIPPQNIDILHLLFLSLPSMWANQWNLLFFIASVISIWFNLWIFLFYSYHIIHLLLLPFISSQAHVHLVESQILFYLHNFILLLFIHLAIWFSSILSRWLVSGCNIYCINKNTGIHLGVRCK